MSVTIYCVMYCRNRQTLYHFSFSVIYLLLTDVIHFFSFLIFAFHFVFRQIYSDFKDINGVKSLSWGLLLCWFLGDSTNLAGAFMTHQGLFQVLVTSSVVHVLLYSYTLCNDYSNGDVE